MNEFIEKLIGRLEEKENEAVLKAPNTSDISNIEYQKWMMKSYGFKEAIEIVEELAEEYNVCWIPCENELPKENGYYLITIKYYHLHNNVTMGCFFDDGEWYKIDKDDKVIAWQPLPKPYNPKGE